MRESGGSTPEPRAGSRTRSSRCTPPTPPRPDTRGQGVARAALYGALDQIAHAGGGLVETISEAAAGLDTPGRFLLSAAVELFEQYGFIRGRQVGKHAWIVSKTVDPV